MGFLEEYLLGVQPGNRLVEGAASSLLMTIVYDLSHLLSIFPAASPITPPIKRMGAPRGGLLAGRCKKLAGLPPALVL